MWLKILAAALLAVSMAAPSRAAEINAAKLGAVRNAALSDQTAWGVVESLTTEVGARPVGSPAMTRARDWAVAKLTALGFKNVTVETFNTAVWTRGEERAEIIGPFPQKLAILGLGRSTSTPKDGLSAEIIVFPSYQGLLDAPLGSLKGKIAVVTQRMPRTQDGSGYGALNAQRTRGPFEAARRGAVGYLVRSLSTDDTRLPHTGAASPGEIPAAALAPADAELLERMAARGKPVTVRLRMTSTYRTDVPGWNVSGDIPGIGAPDEVIVIGGHLDSWDVGDGAVDDAAGVAITTAAAKVAASQGPLRRTIRVVMWGSEEQGGSGGAYAKQHAIEARSKMIVVGESDSGAGRIWRVAVPALVLDHPHIRAFAAAVQPLRVMVDRAPPQFGGADVQPLIELGAPFVDFSQDMNRYFDLHHSDDDTLDKVDPGDLAQNVAVWAAFLYVAAGGDIVFKSNDRPVSTGQ
nr:M20/M25/M40 family metallo-hydrolase [Phenylobacterium immobile]